MKTLSVREARARYDVVKKALETEGRCMLAQRGKPYARVVPFEVASNAQMPPHPATCVRGRLPDRSAFRACMAFFDSRVSQRMIESREGRC